MAKILERFLYETFRGSFFNFVHCQGESKLDLYKIIVQNYSFYWDKYFSVILKVSLNK